DDERGRADGMARTIQIAVENALAVRNREHSELVGLLNDLTSGQREIDWIRIIDRDGQILAASSALTPALPPSIGAVARAIDAGMADMVEKLDRRRTLWVYVLPVRYVAPGTTGRSGTVRLALEIAFLSPDADSMGRQAAGRVLVPVV